jgi:acyl carrier protein
LFQWFRDRLVARTGIDPNAIRLQTPIEHLGVDSLDIVELVMELEEQLGIRVPEGNLERPRTLADVIRLIRRMWAGPLTRQ